MSESLRIVNLVSSCKPGWRDTLSTGSGCNGSLAEREANWAVWQRTLHALSVAWRGEFEISFSFPHAISFKARVCRGGVVFNTVTRFCKNGSLHMAIASGNEVGATQATYDELVATQCELVRRFVVALSPAGTPCPTPSIALVNGVMTLGLRESVGTLESLSRWVRLVRARRAQSRTRGSAVLFDPQKLLRVKYYDVHRGDAGRVMVLIFPKTWRVILNGPTYQGLVWSARRLASYAALGT